MNMECRDSHGLFTNHTIYTMWTYSLCYVYLFPSGDYIFNYNTTLPGLVNKAGAERGLLQEIQDTEVVCESLGEHDCTRWKQCHVAAIECCNKQVDNSHHREGYCPHTWDGWSCFEATEPGRHIQTTCPPYILYGSLHGYVEKECTENGSWALHPTTHKEWSDYSNCVSLKEFKGVIYAGVVANALSLILLLPATFVLLYFKQLRVQQRIQLHVCLFISFLLTAILSLLWQLLIYSDRVNNTWSNTFMVRKQGACKVIYILLRYATSANYFWMFCEGFYLYRLLVQAFRVPRHMKLYFVFGWATPAIPVAVYSLVRWKFANDTCWLKNAGWFEWIVYSPNLLIIVVNLVFLVGILKILLTQLHQHPNEPSNYRRAIKATFVLVPLFGLQLFLVIYRPNNAAIQNAYEIISKVIIDSQGAIIALVFCYFNREVMTCVKTTLQSWKLWKSKQSPNWITNYTVVSQKITETVAEKPAKTAAVHTQNGEDVISLKDMTTWWNGKDT